MQPTSTPTHSLSARLGHSHRDEPNSPSFPRVVNVSMNPDEIKTNKKEEVFELIEMLSIEPVEQSENTVSTKGGKAQQVASNENIKSTQKEEGEGEGEEASLLNRSTPAVIEAPENRVVTCLRGAFKRVSSCIDMTRINCYKPFVNLVEDGVEEVRKCCAEERDINLVGFMELTSRHYQATPNDQEVNSDSSSDCIGIQDTNCVRNKVIKGCRLSLWGFCMVEGKYFKLDVEPTEDIHARKLTTEEFSLIESNGSNTIKRFCTSFNVSGDELCVVECVDINASENSDDEDENIGKVTRLENTGSENTGSENKIDKDKIRKLIFKIEYLSCVQLKIIKSSTDIESNEECDN